MGQDFGIGFDFFGADAEGLQGWRGRVLKPIRRCRLCNVECPPSSVAPFALVGYPVTEKSAHREPPRGIGESPAGI